MPFSHLEDRTREILHPVLEELAAGRAVEVGGWMVAAPILWTRAAIEMEVGRAASLWPAVGPQVVGDDPDSRLGDLWRAYRATGPMPACPWLLSIMLPGTAEMILDAPERAAGELSELADLQECLAIAWATR